MTELPEPGPNGQMLLIDLSCWAYRFFATTGQYSSWHCFNFLDRVLTELSPTHVVVCCDTEWPTFRHDLAPGVYKAQRSDPDPTLLEQRRLTKEMLDDCHGLRPQERKGFEADDIVATMAERALDQDLSVIVLAQDKDLLQLASDRCVLWNGKWGVDGKVMGPKHVRSRYKVKPCQLRDFLALVGDSSDNVPGAKGIGPKAACELLSAFGTLEGIFEFASKETPVGLFEKKPRLGRIVREQRQNISLSADLVTLRRDVPLAEGLDWAAWS